MLVLQASRTSSLGSVSLGSQVHAAAVNGDRNTLLKIITGKLHTNSTGVVPDEKGYTNITNLYTN